MLRRGVDQFCSGRRAALAGLLAALATLTLIFQAELPLHGALQAAVGQAAYSPPLLPGCESVDLASASAQLQPFDGRWSGYSSDEARDILCAMEMRDGAGKSAYLERHFPLDMIYPFFYGPAIAIIWLYLMRGVGRFRLLLALAPLVAAGLDLSENMAIRALIEAGPGALSSEAVAWAAALTRSKYFFLCIGLFPTFALLILHLIWRPGAPSAQADLA